MKNRLLALALLLTSLIGYLAWGNNQEVFLYQIEWDIISKLVSDPSSVIHPLVLLPLLGQLLLLITVFSKRPGKILLLTGLGCIAILFLMMLLVGLLSSKIKIILLALPYLIVALITLWYNRKKTQ
jgi:cobalamin biosynthesis protein CobD/CbiB